MADRFELVAIALPETTAPELLAPAVANFIAVCWNGVSRAQLLDRARRVGLHVSLRRLRDPAVGGVQRYALRLASKDGGKFEEVGGVHVSGMQRCRDSGRLHGAARIASIGRKIGDSLAFVASRALCGFTRSMVSAQ